jgi:translocation and assembly module TamB
LQIWETAGDRAEARLSTAYRVHVRAGSAPEGDALTVCAVLGMTGREGTPGWMCREASEPAEGELLSRLRVPVRWVPGQLLPVYDEAGTITSRSTFNDVHVEPVLTLIPGIVTGDAVVDGSVRASGPLASLRLEGELDLSEGQVQIEGLGQHLHGIAGRLELRGQEVVFPEDRPLSARDAGGLAVAHGRVRFEGIVPRAVDLRVRADAFPIRREGIVLAWLTGRASIAGRIAEDSTTSEITTRDFVVRLPEQTAATLQPLGPHPEIVVIGGQRPTEAGRAESTYSVIVDVDASDPFWVRRSDFAALVTAQLDATYRDPNLYVGGRADIRRGTFEIFGKRFKLQAGSSLVFDETSAELDPQVNITALYEVPGRRGATVTVTVTGTLTSPELDFTSTETNDRAEIIALLVAGGRRETGTAEREASEQAASFLAGLTAGILTLGLRQEFGDVIPVLAIESEGLGGTRVRVGINADDLIPDFLRDVVTGAYIEGFVTATADTATGTTAGPGGIGGGVTLEFTLPRGFLLRGTYVPVDNGSLDLLYEP